MATLSSSVGPISLSRVTPSAQPPIVPDALLTNDPPAVELWLIPPGGMRPGSVGLIQLGRPIKLKSPSDLAGRAHARCHPRGVAGAARPAHRPGDRGRQAFESLQAAGAAICAVILGSALASSAALVPSALLQLRLCG